MSNAGDMHPLSIVTCPARDLSCPATCGGSHHAQEEGGGVVGRAHEGQGAETVHQGVPIPLAPTHPHTHNPDIAHPALLTPVRWVEEEDKEYTGEPAVGGGYDDMAGMGGGGMGGMDFGNMMGGMGGMGDMASMMGGMSGMGGADFDEDDDDDALDDLEPKDLPPIGGDEDGPPPLEEVD
eukprot:scaffold4886_cov123-Isochrysis_galbana.AAC.7